MSENDLNLTLQKALTDSQQSKMQISRRERRPDREVYVPRARRSQTTPPTTAITTTATTTNIATTTTAALSVKATAPTNSTGSSNSDIKTNYQNCDSIISITNASGAVSTTSSRADDNTKKKLKAGKKTNTSSTLSTSSVLNKSERIHKQISSKMVNDQIREFPTNVECEGPESRQFSAINNFCDSEQVQSSFQASPAPSRLQPAELIYKTNEMNTTKKKRQKHTNSISTNTVLQNGKIETNLMLPNVPKVSNILIEQIGSGEQNIRRHHSAKSSKCDIDEQELKRASKEINRSNRRIIKQTFVSDILEIPEKIEHSLLRPKLNGKFKSTPLETLNGSTEEEEDDWESKYNDTGDCLDPKMLQELETAVEKVKITEPKTDYSAFFNNQSILNNEEFPHVLEVSNFPVEFRNQDLYMVFSRFKESGFDIKWVDDTHALAVFSSSKVAAEVLTMGHPFVVLKPLAEATTESRLKAKKCSSSLQPYKPRPETCVTMARRLVSGALGMRLETTAEERENERNVLRRAKERKLLAAKQRDEAWES